jgi:hypothetical protein
MNQSSNQSSLTPLKIHSKIDPIEKKAPARIHGQGLYTAQATLPDQAFIGPR